MKATIEVQSKKEGELIKTALDDATTRAFVQVVGALLPFSKVRRVSRGSYHFLVLDALRTAVPEGQGLVSFSDSHKKPAIVALIKRAIKAQGKVANGK